MKSRRIWRTGLIALGILAGAWAFAALLLPVVYTPIANWIGGLL